MLSNKTWPNWNQGTDLEGVELILQSASIDEDEYKMGKTKIFIRNPKTVCLIKNYQFLVDCILLFCNC